MDSAILVRQTAQRTVVRGNRLANNLFGVYLHGAADSRVENNLIDGRRDLRLAEAGNGVSIWNARAPGSRQPIRGGATASRQGSRATSSRQQLHRLRFAIHYMSPRQPHRRQPSRGNHVGWAIMYRALESDNVSDDDRDHGCC